ncbi:MAG TPA: hypothetical protein VM425_00330 [Myxococcota bacterium]|nr:hypothetical protein [Myxococcota bacterium]
MRTVFMMFVLLVLMARPVIGQTVVSMDSGSAANLLSNHGFGQGVLFLKKLANNYKKYSNVRVHSSWYEESIATLAKALREDFDGSGSGYVPDMTIWSIEGTSGTHILLASSMLNQQAILMSTELNYMKGMIAFEILAGIKNGSLPLPDAQRRALYAGIEMQIVESEDGRRMISFFGHQPNEEELVGKLIVIEPPDLVWN